MNVESKFKHEFYLTQNGNYFSRRQGITIYRKSHRDVWAYCLNREPSPKYGRLEFHSPQECYEWVIKQQIIK